MRAVYVIDDDTDVRTSLAFLLETAAIRVSPFASASAFIDRLPDLAPAPILLDVRMAGIDGLELLRVLQQRGVAWPIIMMTAHGDVPMAVRAMKLGAIEFLEKPFCAETLGAILDAAFAKADHLRHLLDARDDARRRIGQLSPRESDVLRLLMQGALNKVVAHHLGLSPRTVEMHRGNALAKLGRKSLVEVMALYATADIAVGEPPADADQR